MLLEYFTSNFMTIMILLSLVIVMIVNRNAKIPAANYIPAVIFLVFIVSILDTTASLINQGVFDDSYMDIETYIKLRTKTDAICYMIRPVIILLEVYIIIPEKKLRLPCAVPAIINAAVFSTALFGSKLAFYINSEGGWQSGPLRMIIYISQMFYVLLLLVFSVIYFKRNNINKSLIVLTIVAQSLTVAVLEYTDILSGYTNAVTALCILEYYIYLGIIYQQKMSETIAEKELRITKDSLKMLRSQIQPHFIFNSLSLIRSLAKRDSVRAVQCIDSFSDYLKAHIGAMQTEEMIMFEKELDHVKAYLSLVQADYTRKVGVEYDLKIKDFNIPPLSLEPIVENAVKYGIGRKGGIIKIASYEDEKNIYVCISDNGTAKNDLTPQATERLGIGIDNTRKRLEMLCDGKLDTVFTDNGGLVTITIPKNA